MTDEQKGMPEDEQLFVRVDGTGFSRCLAFTDQEHGRPYIRKDLAVLSTSCPRCSLTFSAVGDYEVAKPSVPLAEIKALIDEYQSLDSVGSMDYISNIVYSLEKLIEGKKDE